MDVRDWLDRFEAAARPAPGAYAASHHHDGGEHSLHLAVGCVVHGDEYGTLPAVAGLVEDLVAGRRTYGGRLTVFLGNPEASLEGERFLESDLNRVFVDDPPDTHEGRRSRAIRPILDAADVLVDLHQTILPTAHPFAIFPFHRTGWQWARALGVVSMWITRQPGEVFSRNACCIDDYVRLAGKPGITLELSQKGFGQGAEARAAVALERLLTVADAVGRGADLEDLAGALPDLTALHTVYREPFDRPDLQLRPGLTNFNPVEAGERVSAPGTPELRVPRSGWLVFPKYPPRLADGAYKRPLPGEIYRICVPLEDHPARIWPDA